MENIAMWNLKKVFLGICVLLAVAKANVVRHDVSNSKVISTKCHFCMGEEADTDNIAACSTETNLDIEHCPSEDYFDKCIVVRAFSRSKNTTIFKRECTSHRLCEERDACSDPDFSDCRFECCSGDLCNNFGFSDHKPNFPQPTVARTTLEKKEIEPAVEEDCKNLDQFCISYVSDAPRFCEKNPEYAQVACRKACKYCQSNSQEISTAAPSTLKPTTTLLQTESTEKSVAIDVATKLLTLPVTTQSQTESAQKTKPTTTPSTETTVTTEANAISSTRRQPSESKAKITQTRSTQRKSGFASVQPTVERNGACKDLDRFCSTYVSDAFNLPMFCKDNDRYTSVACRKTCKFCISDHEVPTESTMQTTTDDIAARPLIEECKDVQTNCEEFKSLGFCIYMADYLKKECARTCGFCSNDATATKSTATEQMTASKSVAIATTVAPSTAEPVQTTELQTENTKNVAVTAAPTTAEAEVVGTSMVPSHTTSDDRQHGITFQPTFENLDCQDERDNCEYMKGMDYCRLMRLFMERNCRRTCEFCPIGKPTIKENSISQVTSATASEPSKESTPSVKSPTTSQIRMHTPSELNENCVDKNERCTEFANKEGYCDYQYEFMAANCPKSCGLCSRDVAGGPKLNIIVTTDPPSPSTATDETANTATLSAAKQTTLKTSTTTTSGQTIAVPTSTFKSFSVNPEPSDDCYDKRTQCPQFASYPSYCDYNRRFMLKYCPKSCGFCIEGNRKGPTTESSKLPTVTSRTTAEVTSPVVTSESTSRMTLPTPEVIRETTSQPTAEPQVGPSVRTTPSTEDYNVVFVIGSSKPGAVESFGQQRKIIQEFFKKSPLILPKANYGLVVYTNFGKVNINIETGVPTFILSSLLTADFLPWENNGTRVDKGIETALYMLGGRPASEKRIVTFINSPSDATDSELKEMQKLIVTQGVKLIVVGMGRSYDIGEFINLAPNNDDHVLFDSTGSGDVTHDLEQAASDIIKAIIQDSSRGSEFTKSTPKTTTTPRQTPEMTSSVTTPVMSSPVTAAETTSPNASPTTTQETTVQTSPSSSKENYNVVFVIGSSKPGAVESFGQQRKIIQEFFKKSPLVLPNADYGLVVYTNFGKVIINIETGVPTFILSSSLTADFLPWENNGTRVDKGIETALNMLGGRPASQKRIVTFINNPSDATYSELKEMQKLIVSQGIKLIVVGMGRSYDIGEFINLAPNYDDRVLFDSTGSGNVADDLEQAAADIIKAIIGGKPVAVKIVGPADPKTAKFGNTLRWKIWPWNECVNGKQQRVVRCYHFFEGKDYHVEINACIKYVAPMAEKVRDC